MEMNKTIIRKAQPRDADAVLSLLEQLGYKSTVDKLTSTLRAEQRNDEIYVAQMNSKVVGLLSVIYFDYFPSMEKVCRITAIVVDSQIRGSGIGSQLIDFAKQLGRENLCSKLEVTTSLSRETTQQYYENIGFNKTSYRYIQDIDTQ